MNGNKTTEKSQMDYELYELFTEKNENINFHKRIGTAEVGPFGGVLMASKNQMHVFVFDNPGDISIYIDSLITLLTKVRKSEEL